MKEINLMKIIRENSSIYNNNIEVDDAIVAMKEACKQVLELAAENAFIQDWYEDGKLIDKKINKQSILSTINQVK